MQSAAILIPLYAEYSANENLGQVYPEHIIPGSGTNIPWTENDSTHSGTKVDGRMDFNINETRIVVIPEADEHSHDINSGAIVSSNTYWSGMSTYHLHAQIMKMIATSKALGVATIYLRINADDNSSNLPQSDQNFNIRLAICKFIVDQYLNGDITTTDSSLHIYYVDYKPSRLYNDSTCIKLDTSLQIDYSNKMLSGPGFISASNYNIPPEIMTILGASQYFVIQKSGRCQHLVNCVEIISDFTEKSIQLKDYTFLEKFKSDAASIMLNQNVSNYPIPIDTFLNLFSPYLVSIGVMEEITFGNVFIILFESLKYHFMIIFVNHPDIELIEKLLVAYDNRRELISSYCSFVLVPSWFALDCYQLSQESNST